MYLKQTFYIFTLYTMLSPVSLQQRTFFLDLSRRGCTVVKVKKVVDYHLKFPKWYKAEIFAVWYHCQVWSRALSLSLACKVVNCWLSIDVAFLCCAVVPKYFNFKSI